MPSTLCKKANQFVYSILAKLASGVQKAFLPTKSLPSKLLHSLIDLTRCLYLKYPSSFQVPNFHFQVPYFFHWKLSTTTFSIRPIRWRSILPPFKPQIGWRVVSNGDWYRDDWLESAWRYQALSNPTIFSHSRNCDQIKTRNSLISFEFWTPRWITSWHEALLGL